MRKLFAFLVALFVAASAFGQRPAAVNQQNRFSATNIFMRQVTFTGVAGAILIKPVSAPSAGTKLFEVQTSVGGSVASIDEAGNLTFAKINNVTVTAPASSATLTIANGKTLGANNSITVAGTDDTTMTFPAVSSRIPGQPVAPIALATQGATINTQNLYATAPAGQYYVCWAQQITRAAASSSSLQTTIGWNNGTAKTTTLASLNGAVPVTTADTSNTLNSTMSNCYTIVSAAGQNITYAVAYSSSGATTMQYALYISLVRLQ